METAIETVDRLSDVQAVALIKRIHRDVARTLQAEALGPAPVDGDLAEIATLSPDVKRTTLDPATSVELSRRLLRGLAADPATAPIVMQAWAEIRDDDSLFIETIVAVGLLANLTLFLATSEAELRVGGLTLRKSAASADLVRAVAEPLVELVRKLPLSR